MQWGDVGGLEGVKQRLKEAVQWPHLQPEALARLGAEPPKGSLLPPLEHHILHILDGMQHNPASDTHLDIAG